VFVATLTATRVIFSRERRRRRRRRREYKYTKKYHKNRSIKNVVCKNMCPRRRGDPNNNK